jgi:hypothetical protein
MSRLSWTPPLTRNSPDAANASSQYRYTLPRDTDPAMPGNAEPCLRAFCQPARGLRARSYMTIVALGGDVVPRADPLIGTIAPFGAAARRR